MQPEERLPQSADDLLLRPVLRAPRACRDLPEERLSFHNPFRPANDMDKNKRIKQCKKWNSYIGDLSWEIYKKQLDETKNIFPYQNRICFYNNSSRDAPVCYLQPDWCPFAHNKQRGPPFRTAICHYGDDCRDISKCSYLHPEFFIDDGRYPGIIEKDDDQSKLSKEQQRLLLVTRDEHSNNIVLHRISWDQLIERLDHARKQIFKRQKKEDIARIKFWAVDWRNFDSDNWSLMIIDDMITKTYQWCIPKRK